MSRSESNTIAMEEIEKLKQKIKKLSRRHRHRRRRSHRTRYSSRSTSRDRSGSPPCNGTITPSKPPEEQHNVESVHMEGDTPIPEALLVALGDENPVEEQYGQEINDAISSRWNNILLKDSEDVKDVLKLYKIPRNCTLLEAPQLNPEVKLALTDTARNRDNSLQEKQQQLGIAITCLGLAMSGVLRGQETTEVLKLMGDAAKLLTSLHYKETHTRRKLVAPLLDKSFITMTETLTRNQYLYGDNLAEKIKNSKDVEKSSFQLRKPKPPTSHSGNWIAPSRIQPRTTMRVGQKRPFPQSKHQVKKTYQLPKRLPKRTLASHPERSYQRAQRQPQRQ